MNIRTPKRSDIHHRHCVREGNMRNFKTAYSRKAH